MPQRGLSSLKPAISRMAASIGIERVGDDALTKLVEYIGRYTSQLCSRIETYQTHTGHKTVKFSTIQYLIPGVIQTEHEGCTAVPANAVEAEALHIAKGRQIYRHAACIFLTRAVMERYIRKNLNPERRISADAVTALIDTVQSRLLTVMESAGVICLHAKRKTLNAGDVAVTIRTMSKCIESLG